MPHFFILLLKINLVLLLFAAAYYLVLRQLTFYVINRLFLAFGILFSTIYPFIDLTDFFHKQNQNVIAFVPSINQRVKAFVPSEFITVNWQLLAILFYVGVFVMAIRLIVQFVSLYRIHKKSAPGTVGNFEVRILDAQVNPFSFWQTVYVNPSLHRDKELQTILEHEQIHVRQWHSLDIILAELSVVFYWFNPGVWLIKKAVKENLEFITDENILKKGVDKKTYQYSLLEVGNLLPAVEIASHFNLSDLKKRIKMMNTKRSSRRKLTIYALILPILLSTTLAFTINKKAVKKQLMPITNIFAKATPVTQPAPKIVVVKDKPAAKRRVRSIFADTATKTKYLTSSISLTGDSATGLPELPEAGALAKVTHLKTVLSGVVKGIQIPQEAFLYKNGDVVDGKGKITKVENATFIIKKSAYVPPVKNPTLKVVVINAYATKAKDSVNFKVGKPSYRVNGNPITEEDLNKLATDNIETVTVIANKISGTGILITTKEKKEN